MSNNRDTWKSLLSRSHRKTRAGDRRRAKKRRLFETLEARNLLATIAVDTFVDENDGIAGGTGTSLRDAVLVANASPGDDIITLPAGIYTLTIPGPGEDGGLTGDLDIAANGSITINGDGAATTIIDAGGAAGLNDRVFNVLPGADLSINDSTITGGNVFRGGGVLNSTAGTLSVTNSTISGNAAVNGAGIANYGTATLTNTTVSGNSANNNGGGIDNRPNSVLTVKNSLFSDNQASSSGGGIWNYGSATTVTNSTFSGNSAIYGGALYQGYEGPMTVTNSTLSGNTASSYGGGVYNYGGAFTINNSILAGNTNYDITDWYGPLVTGANNLSDVSAFVPGWVGSVTNFDTNLADNGGPTLTHALLPGSNALAVDAGGSPLTTDQRDTGFDRVVNGTVDIGAFEFIESNEPPTANADGYAAAVFAALVTSDVDTTPRDNVGDSLDGDTNNDSVLVNDTDVDAGDVLEVVSADGNALSGSPGTGDGSVTFVTGLGATVSMNDDGTFTYNAATSGTLLSLAEGATIEDTFSYTMTDGNDEFDTATVTVTVTGASENSVHIVDCACDDGTKAIVIRGSGADDKIDVKLGSVAGTIDIKIKGSMGSMAGSVGPNGSFHVTVPGTDVSKVIVYGLDGNDAIKVHSNLNANGWLFGGSGDDKLRGGDLDDILVGGDGDDKLEGKKGRDILIGGDGADKIKGDKDEDILIAGSTAYDNNLAALCGIQDEWTSANSFEDRVNNIHDGSGVAVGANNGYFLDTSTVQVSDGYKDELDGGSGSDWFIADTDSDGDKVKGFDDDEDIFGLDADWFNS